ncbi:hypothetical protein [Streptomyces bobili]|uniref:hypothetical protein n=1 Tax=Streptomyces bobili TaxID=67280 RepID=UPI00371F6C4E
MRNLAVTNGDDAGEAGGHLDAVAALELRPHHGVAATTPRHPLGKTIWAEISSAGSGSQLT